MSNNHRTTPGRAVVVGASMGGLLAARALSDTFDQIVLLERDSFPAEGENRKGVPQGRHIHLLLERGRQAMERLLPGLTEDLTRLGAAHIPDAGLDVRWFYDGAYHQPGPCGIPGLGIRRPLLEAAVRRHVLDLPNIEAMACCSVSDLTWKDDFGRVSGVILQRKTGTPTDERMTADLVVDATGRGSRSCAWLKDAGYAAPPKEEVRIKMGYTSCFFRRTAEHLPGLDGIVLLPKPPYRRPAVLLAQDNDRWVCTLGGYLGDHVPASFEPYFKAARELPIPAIYDVISNAEPLTEPVSYNFPANLRRRYETLRRFPEGFLVLGDAICSFNPIYGQGMTVAALEAEALSKLLAKGTSRLGLRFFKRAAKIVDASWDTAVGGDLAYPEVEGPRSPMTRFLNWYIDKLHHAAHRDAAVSKAFLDVINMTAAPPSVLRPSVVWRVIRGNRRRLAE